MIQDPATLALLLALVAVIALVGWAASAWRGHGIRERCREQADRAIGEVQVALAACEDECARLEAELARLPRYERKIERLTVGLRAGADEMRRLGDRNRQLQRYGEQMLARHSELQSQLETAQVRFNETARLLVEAQTLNARLEDELGARGGAGLGRGSERVPAQALTTVASRLR